MCKDFYDEVCKCTHCTEGETVIDCRIVPTSSYDQVVESIIGDLEKYGWVVMRGLIIDYSTETDIKNIDMKDPGTQGTWKSIRSSANNHKMKYNINSRIPKYQMMDTWVNCSKI